MKHILIKDNKILPLNGYNAIALFPFIFVDTNSRRWKIYRKELINHETIHLKQQVELLFVLFYIWYVIEYIIRIFQYQSPQKAYRNISFEREAYDNEDNLKYLESRKLFSWIKYLKK